MTGSIGPVSAPDMLSVGTAGAGRPKGAAGTGFRELFTEALDTVNRLQLEADAAAEALALGEIEDVHQVMIAAAKADLALQLTIQVRNKVLDAYHEISRMQI